MLPENWVKKIFTTFEGRYGTLFKDRWKGCDLDNVMTTWREELSGFSDKPECIGHALKSLADEKFPPTLPEFIAACRRAPAKEAPALPYKPTAEDAAHQRELSHKVAEAVRPKEFDGLLWAKKPKSQKAMDYVADAKKHANRFPALAAVFDYLLENKICNEHGKLLHRWDNNQWVKA
jgi:hypothetical protein